MALFRFGRRDEPKPGPEAAAGEQPPVIAAATDAVATPPRQGFLERLQGVFLFFAPDVVFGDGRFHQDELVRGTIVPLAAHP